MSDFGARTKARQTLRTAKNLEHERLEARQVDNGPLPILQVKQKNV